MGFADCRPETRYLDCVITPDRDRVKLDNVVFEHCRFAGDYSQTECLDVSWLNCDLANTDWQTSVFSGCEWQSTRLTGCEWSAVRLIQCALRSCTAQLINLSATQLETVTWADCRLEEASMQAVRVRGQIAFPGCQLEGTDLTDTDLRHWDLSGASFTNLTLSPQLMAGLKIAAWQAPTVAAALGVQICD